MNGLEYFKLALVALRAAKVRAFLTMLGIIIGTAAVILLVALGAGLEKYITQQIESLGSNLIFVFPGSQNGGRGPGGATVNRLLFKDAEYLRLRLSNVKGVSAVINKSGSLKYNAKEVKGSTLYGVDQWYTKVATVKIAEGRFISEEEFRSGRRVVVLGPSAATKLSNNIIGKDILLSNRRYTVIGITEKKGAVFGVDQDNSVYLPIDLMAKQFGVQNINSIYLAAVNPEDVPQLKKKAKELMLRRLTEDDFTVASQEETLNTIQGILGVLSVALGGIAAISLVVGGIGIMNIMLVSVTERTREIGLRKAIGAPPNAILWQFLIEAIVLSIVGGIIGIGIGYLGAALIGYFITTVVPMWAVVVAFGFSVAVGVIFGVAPAFRASRLDPIVALRYE
jgi:putative ABC transport system permease protein